VGYSGDAYTGVSVDFGGNNYAEGDTLTVKGSLLGGADGGPGIGNDLQFTIDSTGTNIDDTVYLSMERVSAVAEPNSLVLTDSASNLGSTANKFNEIHAVEMFASTFTGNVTGDVTGDLTGTADKATNLVGSTIGSIPYQSAADTTTLLSPGTVGRYLKTNGPGAAPSWSDIIIPDGSAESLTGTTLASGVVNSSLTSVGTLTSLTVSGNLAVATNKLTVNSTTGAVGINNALTVGGNLTANGLTAFSVDNAVIAGGTNLAGATALEANINIVTSVAVNTGVRLPEAVAGLRILVKNTGANNLALYPGSGAQINDNLVNEAVVLEPNACLEYFCSTSAVAGVGGQWNTINATFA
jgi:hypothetical protein